LIGPPLRHVGRQSALRTLSAWGYYESIRQLKCWITTLQVRIDPSSALLRITRSNLFDPTQSSDSPLFLPLEFQALDGLSQESTYLSRRRHHSTRHCFPELIISCTRLLCTCKVGFCSMAAPCDRGSRKEHEFASLVVKRVFQILKPQECCTLFKS
jgi:hypothetical protein